MTRPSVIAKLSDHADQRRMASRPPMPKNATFEQRVAWHREHAAHCDCRKPPPDIAAILAQKEPPAPAS
jgi:hypothetical protein